MPSTILHKRNDTPGTAPLTSSLSAGELAMNVSDGKLFIKTTDETIRSFSNDSQVPYTLNQTLSSIEFQYGSNSITQVFGAVLGGYNNDITGAGSTVINGEDNDIAGDFAFIGGGYKNKITSVGDYSAILAGSNNFISHENSFAIGSNLSSHSAGFTYVNNISAQGGVYGDGSNLTGIVSEISRARVFNADTVTLVRGNVVYSFGAQGDTMSVKLASNTSESTSSKTLGFVNETIAPGGTGYVTIAGTLTNLSVGSLTPGDALWLGSTAGSFTTTKPIAPNHTVYLGVVERANNGNGIIYVKVQNGYELNEIHDVLVSSVSAGDVLRRNNSNTLWQNTKDGLNWDSVYTTVSANSANWDSAYNYVTANSVNLTATNVIVTNNLTVSDTVSAKFYQGTLIDWMTLVRGYKTTPTLLATIGTGEVYTYVYSTATTDKTYYRYIATDGSEDSFYGNFNNPTLSNLIATKKIIL